MQVVLDLMDVMQSSGKPTMNMVVLGVIDRDTSLQQLQDDAFLLDESDTRTRSMFERMCQLPNETIHQN